MPQSATIESLPEAFEIVKEMNLFSGEEWERLFTDLSRRGPTWTNCCAFCVSRTQRGERPSEPPTPSKGDSGK